MLLTVLFCLLGGGADSPYVLIFFVLLAHAALACPPVGMLIAGAGNVLGYLVVALVGGGAAPVDLLMGALVLVVATGTSAFASHNHVRAYRQVAAYARQVAVLAAHDGLTGCLNHRSFHDRLREGAVAGDHVTLLAAADRAVYQAKRGGRDRVVTAGATDRPVPPQRAISAPVRSTVR